MVYRYASAMNLSVKINGVPVSTGVLYGVIKYVKSIQHPTVFCMEGYPALFKSYYPQYKGNRSKEKDEEVQVPVFDIIACAQAIAEARGLYCKFVYSPNQEADQVIASLTKATFNRRLTLFGPAKPESDFYWKRYKKLVPVKFEFPPDIDSVLIKTTDSDMYQLIQPGVKIAKELSDNEGGTETPKAVKGIAYETIPVYKAMVGDVSDNIPNLVKDFPQKRLFKILDDVITDRVELDHFITATQVKEKYQGAEDLQRYLLSEGKLAQLKLNRKITTLDFYSMPWELRVPEEVDALSVIEKYKIKI